jgi:hypothetical protein
MSDWHPDFDQFEADLNDRHARTSSPQNIRIFVGANNPEGVAFDYEILD